MVKSQRVYRNNPIEGIVRIPKNISEHEFYSRMTREGWEVVRRGWPDFACFKGDEFIAVEVKPGNNYYLKRSQYRLMAALAARGIKCYLWAPDKGFSPVIPR